MPLFPITDRRPLTPDEVDRLALETEAQVKASQAGTGEATFVLDLTDWLAEGVDSGVVVVGEDGEGWAYPGPGPQSLPENTAIVHTSHGSALRIVEGWIVYTRVDGGQV